MYLSYIILGVVAGIFGGLFGIGGGTIMIPVMVYLFGLTQHQAQGTSLAVMIPPIGILAVMRYYYSGNVKIGMATFVCLGFLVGGLIGAHFVHKISDPNLKKIFGIYLVIMGSRMILFK
jgi:uncharacterized membrane protein YfcA